VGDIGLGGASDKRSSGRHRRLLNKEPSSYKYRGSATPAPSPFGERIGVRGPPISKVIPHLVIARRLSFAPMTRPATQPFADPLTLTLSRRERGSEFDAPRVSALSSSSPGDPPWPSSSS